MIDGTNLGILGKVFGEESVETNFADMWYTLATIALLTAALVVFAFKDETKNETNG
jgi:hypothetical protein